MRWRYRTGSRDFYVYADDQNNDILKASRPVKTLI